MKQRYLALALILAAVIAVFGGVPAKAASQPLLSPAEILMPEQIQPGMTGYGKSVFNGTKVETFNVKVLGVMRHTDFNGDMILIRITSGPVVKNHWGIIAGMSGSPIYIKGKLVGALAFAWSYAKEPIAGVTPIRQMAENFSPNDVFPQFKPVGTGKERRIAAPPTLVPRTGSVRIGNRVINRAQLYLGRPAPKTTDSHTMAMTPIATPVMVNGLSPRAMKTLAGLFEPYGLVPMSGGGKATMPLPGKPTPGSSIGIQLAGGDIDMTVVGTVTYVKDGRVLAMGHPFEGMGAIDLPMVNAYVSAIIPSMEVSFKMASAGTTVVGRWTEDRPWSCGGMLSQKSRTIPATFKMWDKTRGLHKTYNAWISRCRQLTPALVASAAGSAIESIAPSQEGTLKVDMEVAAKGLPITKRSNTYSTSTSGGDMDLLAALFGGGGASSPDAELLQIMDTLENNAYGPVAPERISLTATWEKERKTANLEDVRTRVKRVKPGDMVGIEVMIQPWNKPKEVKTIQVQIPQNAPAGRLQLGIGGGASADSIKSRLSISDPRPTNLAQQLERISKQEQNNELIVEMAVESTGVEVKGQQLNDLPSAVAEALLGANATGVRSIRDHVTTRVPMPYVVSGSEMLSFIVDSDEKDKAGRGLSTSMSQIEMGLPSSLLRSLLEPGVPGSEESTYRYPRTKTQSDDFENLDLESDPGDKDPGLEKTPEKPGDETPDMETPPDVPSFDELDELEGQDPEAITPDRSSDKVKGQSVLRLPVIWRDDTEKDFTKGKTFGTAVNTDGRVDLAPAEKMLYNAPDGMVWAETSDGKGNIYVASWLDGRITRLTADGTATTVLTAPDVAIQALTADANGVVYAAASPSGTIYKLGAGKPAILCTLPARYVWGLVAESDGGLLAGTGPDGRLFRISADGTVSIAFQAPDRHIIALASGPGGVVYAATYPKGKVYRITGSKVEPFYETIPTVTALSLAVDSKGYVYVGTSPSGQIVRLDAQSKAKLFYKSAERHIYSMWAATDGSLYAATGPRARIYRITQDGNAEVAWDGKNGNVVGLAESDGKLYATLAGGRQVVALDLHGQNEGTFVSSVLDATGPAKWGQIRWNATVSEGSSVTLQTRSGNTAFPDSTWTDWSAACVKATGEQVTSPPARYLQYRATLKPGAQAAPSLQQVEVFYLSLNRAPELKLLDPGKTFIWSGKKSIKWSATDIDKGDVLTYQTFYSADQGKTWTEIKETSAKVEAKVKETTPTPATPEPKTVEEKTKLEKRSDKTPEKTVTPEKKAEPVVDEDKDVPTVVITPKKTDEPETEVPVVETPSRTEDKTTVPTRSTSISWDTKALADGVYLIKVIASDKRSNPTDPMTDEKISEPITVDNTAPVIAVDKEMDGKAPASTIKVTDASTYVAGLEYRIDGGEWTGAACADGIYDSQAEDVVIPVDTLPVGEHKIEFRARDGAGNEAKAEVKYKK